MTDPRLVAWRARLASRADEAVEAIAAVPGVYGVVLGGSCGRGEHWPLSDLDLAVVCVDRPVEEVAREVDERAYQLSEMWGSSGIYTAVDAGRLTYTADEIRVAASTDPPHVPALMRDARWLHGIDKMYGGAARHDPDGLVREFLDVANRSRFDTEVVRLRVEAWQAQARQAIESAERALGDGDEIDAWIGIRRAGSALAEIATERWGERAGSLGRYWTQFEARARRAGDPELAEAITRAVWATPIAAAAVVESVPEWLRDRISLSYAARRLVDEPVTAEQNVRDSVLAYAVLYRRRFPAARPAWLSAPTGADPATALAEVAGLLRTT